ncbi:hypothetical protein COEREDRAFT_79989 [Coemansia reversa NRRL 1564]|uniref:Uncharacterized protein n=1 Tax=Coemansia reversa (strain ATCC 12441 / NRRL 1564) TaxID=763665 RepID=A0A2G5BGC0_COERN|nr:hypothetical protein COEREDRAFT_79989 [Coemansia reversa NRRL 1564]|eukprot:PIA18043.1 hypothetical protein COEREDRAFT_79989 [Coemansia reversa NRRL 1564]
MVKSKQRPKRKRERPGSPAKETITPLQSKPAKAPVRALRRTQSATLPDDAASREGRSEHKGLLRDMDSESDSDFPDALSLLKSPVNRPVKTANGRRRKLVKSVSDIPSPTKADVSDADPTTTTLKVPGELVLAYALRKYYPARVLSQPTANRFTIEFFDGSSATLSRGRILTMYESKFYTCPLGAFCLVGDEPVQITNTNSVCAVEQEIDLGNDFEGDTKLFHKLVNDMEAVRGHLDTLHKCSSDQLEETAKLESRMAVFFGDDASARRRLPSRVYKGFLNRAEFDFLGRLLSRWYTTPPLALMPGETNEVQEATCVGDRQPGTPSHDNYDENTSVSDGFEPRVQCSTGEGTSAETPKSEITETTEPLSQDDLPGSELASQTVKFIHEVLLPHAIKRLTMARESCSLVESEARMIQGDSGIQWVDQILAARGISRDTL